MSRNGFVVCSVTFMESHMIVPEVAYMQAWYAFIVTWGESFFQVVERGYYACEGGLEASCLNSA